MFFIQKKKNIKNDVLEMIKQDIEIQLGNKGVVVSGVDLKIDTNNLLLSLYINSSKRLA